MSKYSEMLEKETNWVTLVNKSLCESESCYYGIAINYGVNFVVRLDANIAMGSSLEKLKASGYDLSKIKIVNYDRRHTNNE